MLSWLAAQDLIVLAMTTAGTLVLVGFVVRASMSWTRARGAPWVPTPGTTVARMLEMANVGADDTVFDLGCGDGRLLVEAARRFGARAVGIEIDPLRYLWCVIRVALLGLRERVTVLRGDLFAADLHEASVVTVYLLPRTHRALEEKLVRELRSDARIVAHAFGFPGLQEIEADESFDCYRYRPVSVRRPGDS